MSPKFVTALLLVATGLVFAVGVPKWAALPGLFLVYGTMFWLIHRGDERTSGR